MTRDVLVAGETLVDLLPDSTAPPAAVESFTRRAGGAPANVAVGLARLGAAPRFWTRIGADPFGEFLAGTLAAAGIPDRCIERDDAAKTALAFVNRASSGPRFTFYREGTADTRLDPDTVPDELLDAVDWVHFGGVALAAEPARGATLTVVERARERGCTVSFDPNARPELWRDAAAFESAVAEALALADVVKATPGDLREAGFAEQNPEALARAVCERGPHTALVTLGERGSLAAAGEDAPWDSGTFRHGGYAVDAVDTTGAGDAFTAGVIDRLSAGESLDAALAFADAVAALATTESGAMTALPTAGAVERFRRGR